MYEDGMYVGLHQTLGGGSGGGGGGSTETQVQAEGCSAWEGTLGVHPLFPRLGRQTSVTSCDIM